MAKSSILISHHHHFLKGCRFCHHHTYAHTRLYITATLFYNTVRFAFIKAQCILLLMDSQAYNTSRDRFWGNKPLFLNIINYFNYFFFKWIIDFYVMNFIYTLSRIHFV